jgi:small redox-active disulfide protein 2
MKVEVLGTGCKRCDQLYENARQAADKCRDRTGIEVTKIGDVNYFGKMGVFMTPGLVIDGEVISVGKVLSVEEVIQKVEEKL